MSKRAVEELTSQVAELRQTVALLQALVKDQTEDIAILKRHVTRLEHEVGLNSGSVLSTTPNKATSGHLDPFSSFARSGTLCPPP